MKGKSILPPGYYPPASDSDLTKMLPGRAKTWTRLAPSQCSSGGKNSGVELIFCEWKTNDM